MFFCLNSCDKGPGGVDTDTVILDFRWKDADKPMNVHVTNDPDTRITVASIEGDWISAIVNSGRIMITLASNNFTKAPRTGRVVVHAGIAEKVIIINQDIASYEEYMGIYEISGLRTSTSDIEVTEVVEPFTAEMKYWQNHSKAGHMLTLKNFMAWEASIGYGLKCHLDLVYDNGMVRFPRLWDENGSVANREPTSSVQGWLVPIYLFHVGIIPYGEDGIRPGYFMLEDIDIYLDPKTNELVYPRTAVNPEDGKTYPTGMVYVNAAGWLFSEYHFHDSKIVRKGDL